MAARCSGAVFLFTLSEHLIELKYRPARRCGRYTTSMTTAAPSTLVRAASAHQVPTIWGLDAMALHDRFWAARGVQVIRQGQPTEIVHHAEFYLLIGQESLAAFRLGRVIDSLRWLKPKMLFARIHDPRNVFEQTCAITGDDASFVRFDRVPHRSNIRVGRVALTPHADLAAQWMDAASVGGSWRKLRRSIPAHQRATISVDGCVFDRRDDQQRNDFVHALVNLWRRPDSTIARARRLSGEVWADESMPADFDTRFVGPVWIGAGRDLDGINSVVGPAVLWDKPNLRPVVEALQWQAIEAGGRVANQPSQLAKRSIYRITKRLFDIAFALILLVVTLPLYPLMMLAIWIEDGRPFFFASRCESVGGRMFTCWKFRTASAHTDHIKHALQQEQQPDTIGFDVAKTPRLTRMGRCMRRANIDAFPQLFHVLRGHMSLVGPRPSPYQENQSGAAWREVRLSIRPGVTGLWQVKRLRESGKGLQEWIRYDVYYVKNASWKMDVYILWNTFKRMVGLR